MNIAGQALTAIGIALMALASLGILRLPDVFARMHAGTKSASLGLAAVLGGTAMMLPEPVVTLKLLVAIAFQFVTAPVAAHVIGRAAYWAGVPLWEGTLYDELGRDEYDTPTEPPPLED